MTGPRYAVRLDGELLRWQHECITKLAEAAGRPPIATILQPSRERLGLIGENGVLARRIASRLAGGSALTSADQTQLPEPSSSTPTGLDFVLSFVDGAADVEGQVEKWAFQMDDIVSAVARGEATITAALVRTRPGQAHETIRQGRFRLQRHSPGATIDEVFSCLAQWPAFALRQSGGPVGLDRLEGTTAETIGGGETFRFVAARVRGLALRGWKAVAEHQDWRIGLVDGGADWPLRVNRPAVRWLPSPVRGEFLADPFPVRWQGKSVILAEHYSHRDRLGRIVAIDPGSPADFRFCDFGVPADTHMSYPYPVLDEAGSLFCVPETHQLREVGLYAPVEFPLRWRKQQVLIAGVAAIDPTPLRHGGSWWMFFADAEGGGDRDLCLWYADRLTGPWQPHPANPVKIDVGSARPAGTPFVHNGDLFRPAQDCSRRYGGRVVIHRVTTLDRCTYREEPVTTVEPIAPQTDGLHTVSSNGELSVIDGNRMRWMPTATAAAMRRALRRLRR